MKTTVTLTALFAFLAITVFSCSKLDVVGNDSARAFNDLLRNAPQLVSEDTANGGWSITAPDSGARFIWSANNVTLEFAAAPFIAAGLDPSRLPDHFILRDSMITVETKWGNEKLSYQEEATPLASYEQIVKLKRGSIGYHGELDHYGISLENGNMFEWAKNLTTNDKDMVFVLNPDPFIAAGVNPLEISGWVFAMVTVDDENGKPIRVYKILKPFNVG